MANREWPIYPPECRCFKDGKCEIFSGMCKFDSKGKCPIGGTFDNLDIFNEIKETTPFGDKKENK